jgi:hypothetical protein
MLPLFDSLFEVVVQHKLVRLMNSVRRRMIEQVVVAPLRFNLLNMLNMQTKVYYQRIVLSRSLGYILTSSASNVCRKGGHGF